MSDGDDGESAPSWVLTYADLVAQLTALFILMLSFARFEPAGRASLGGAVAQTFGATRAQRPAVGYQVPRVEETPDSAATGRVAAQLRALIERDAPNEDTSSVEATLTSAPRGAVARFGENYFFDSMGSAVRPSAWRLLDGLVELVRRERVHLCLELVLSGAPLQATERTDAARLAGARGLAMVRYMMGRDPELAGSSLEVRVREAPRPPGGGTLPMMSVQLQLSVEQLEAPP